MKYIINIVAIVLLFIGCASDNGNKMSLDESEFGLRSASLYSENVDLRDFAYSTTPAGESTNIERAYENAPPMIPHDVEGMLDITRDYNACIDCHSRQNAPLMNATPVPLSHTYDTFSDKQKDSIVDSRYNCNLCHTPQANVSPLVGNNFKPEFRSSDGKSKSNLLEVLDEGVK